MDYVHAKPGKYTLYFFSGQTSVLQLTKMEAFTIYKHKHALWIDNITREQTEAERMKEIGRY